jgi:hypothetical protein
MKILIPALHVYIVALSVWDALQELQKYAYPEVELILGQMVARLASLGYVLQIL